MMPRKRKSNPTDDEWDDDFPVPNFNQSSNRTLIDITPKNDAKKPKVVNDDFSDDDFELSLGLGHNFQSQKYFSKYLSIFLFRICAFELRSHFWIILISIPRTA